MFGSLKKRLKEVVQKVSSKKEPDKEKIAEAQQIVQEVKAEAPEKKPEEPKKDTLTEKDEFGIPKEGIWDVPTQAPVKEKPKEPLYERLKDEVEEKIEKLEELEEKIDEERLPEKVREELIEERQAFEEVKTEQKQGILGGIFKRVTEKEISESEIVKMLQELQIALLENDVALEVAEKICDDVKNSLTGARVKRGNVDSIIKESLKKSMIDVMSQEKIDIVKEIEKKYKENKKPFVILFCGFNGTGKTSTIAKFAKRFESYKPTLAAGDTFRAASIEQLEEHARRLGVDCIKHKYGSDPAAVTFDAIKHAEATGSKVVLADTAGRSHSNVNLMDELKKIIRVNKPDMKILVLDSLTGNDIYDQSNLFNDAVGVDAIILTKADIYEKGGAALSASYTIKKPILFLCIGQEYDDLKEFSPEEIVNTLIE